MKKAQLNPRSHRSSKIGPLAFAGWAALLGLVGWGLSADAESVQSKSAAEIEAVRRQIADSRERVIAHEQQERELLRLLEEIDQGLATLRDDVRVSERRARRAQESLTSVEGRRVAVDRRLAATRRAMAKRALALYKTGDVGALRVIFASSDLQQMLSKMWTLERLLKYDGSLATRFQQEREALMIVEAEAASALKDRDMARRSLATKRSALKMERKMRRVLLDRVRGDRSQERTLLVELERAGRALEETVSRLGGTDWASVPWKGDRFFSLKGRMRRPVAGRIRSHFGRVVDSQYQTETFNNGIEISAPEGERVIAVARGQVRYAGWFRGYGKIVILEHAQGYFTVFGHLDEWEVEVGDMVEPGAVLGRVGETGSLHGPGLYFELRKGRDPQDPALWLATG
ncbi:MAG: peptidoglycan DD-metalloendopeptidase family protein [Myxococcota bacterium]|nr:peptidoglycan DD-metalloendopeptidase family protein [Myxococcota bacterium]